MADVFISYSQADRHSRDLAASLAKQLAAANVNVWYDQMIDPGGDFYNEIEKQLRQAKIFIVLLGAEALSSPAMNFELGVAASRSNTSRDVNVIPVLFGGTAVDELPRFLRGLTVIDANNESDEQASREIIEAVARLPNGV
jgi:hypothetical protein